MIQTIISNNCAGAAVMHELGMEFKSPTINLQILPEEFTKFCWNFQNYMRWDLIEYKPFMMSRVHKDYLYKMFGGVPDMPLGLLWDVMICFQHYETFADAKKKWDERKARIDYENIGFMFYARGEEYRKETEDFLALEVIKNKLALTQGFSVDGSIRFDGDGFSVINGKLLLTQVTDFKAWRENG